ncbi:MAG: aspartate-semialdehyde dehydrogenase [Myxococcota bacterium]|nr:aspartate-semialdehyde dehydrogenase [Myxococcota bacterium]
MVTVGFIGWRGMVGSVLLDRMRQERDFNGFRPIFASTSQVNAPGPNVGVEVPPLQDAFDIRVLLKFDIIVTCQGSGYTKKVYPLLKDAGWDGYWIDAASALRMDPDSVIVLDPVNRDVIDQALSSGIKKYIGGNCTVSLMLMAVSGLFREGLVAWLTSMTYQAASGAGAKSMRELVAQMGAISSTTKNILQDPNAPILDLDDAVTTAMNSVVFPTDTIGAPLAGSALPWIDSQLDSGQSREEWKGYAETNKILETGAPVPVDGICVRIGSMRCHSQALTIKLTRDVPIEEIEAIISGANDWVQIVPNTKEASLDRLTPAAVTGKLTVPIGRIRKMTIGPEYLTAFTVGDQLLWGAAEPIRRILKLVLDHLGG